MTREDSYKETKECACISCGKMVTVTKFASPAKVQCDECKNIGATANPDLVASAKTKRVERQINGGETKECECIKCGTMVTVTKFASPAKVLCPDCKGENSPSYGDPIDVKIDMSKLDRNVIPPIEEYVATPALVANTHLRNVICPACKHEYMKMVKILDWSIRGLIIHYQCPQCMLLMSISEQSKHMIRYSKQGVEFDYSGADIEDLIGTVKHTRIGNIVQQLMELLKKNDITVDGIKLPPYICENDRPVPIGYHIPRDDPSIKAIDEAIKYLKQDENAGEVVTNLELVLKDGI